MSDQPPPPGESDSGQSPGQPPPPAPESGAGAQQRGAGDPAGLGVRFGARLIDHVLLFIVNFVIAVVIIAGVIFTDASGASAFGGGASFGGFVASLITAVITIGYFAFMESSRGQTVGKMLLNLRTVGVDGGNPTMEQAVRRNGWYIVGVVPFIGWLIQLGVVIYIAVTINNSTTNQGWHDEFGDGTQVVRTS